MKNYFPQNSRHNKAALILSSMSADMVQDIVNLVNSRGLGILNDINQDQATTRPYAIFSRDFINDEDFPLVFMGMTTIMTAQFRKLSVADNDFYQEVLQNAFHMPPAMAKAMSKSIETLDIIGANKDNDGTKSWYNKAGAKLAEVTRQATNWLPKVFHLDWENDQDQKYDIDFLYEVKLLGEQVDRLISRQNLMTGQAKAAGSLGFFQGASSNYGDIYDSGVGDTVDAAELELLSSLKSEMGFPFVPLIAGAFKKLTGAGSKANKGKLAELLAKSGLIKKTGTSVDPSYHAAAGRLLSNNPGPLASAFTSEGDAAKVRNAIELLNSLGQAQELAPVVADVEDQYGDVAANALVSGDIPGMFNEILSLAGDVYETTGDTALDEGVYGDALDEMGDLATDESEIGGLFKRARINRKIRQASRRGRRTTKREGKLAKKNWEQAQLIRARQLADEAQVMNVDRVPSVDDYLAQMNVASARDNVDQPGYSDDNTMPDDAYNPHSSSSIDGDEYQMSGYFN